MNLEKERTDLFNMIAGLDNESIEKVKKYIKRTIHGKRTTKTETPFIDYVTDEEIENAMRPLTHEEQMERLRLAEADSVWYTHEEVKKAVKSWKYL